MEWAFGLEANCRLDSVGLVCSVARQVAGQAHRYLLGRAVATSVKGSNSEVPTVTVHSGVQVVLRSSFGGHWRQCFHHGLGLESCFKPESSHFVSGNCSERETCYLGAAGVIAEAPRNA